MTNLEKYNNICKALDDKFDKLESDNTDDNIKKNIEKETETLLKELEDLENIIKQAEEFRSRNLRLAFRPPPRRDNTNNGGVFGFIRGVQNYFNPPQVIRNEEPSSPPSQNREVLNSNRIHRRNREYRDRFDRFKSRNGPSIL